MNSKQKKTLQAVFTSPTRSSIAWKDVESLIIALGGIKEEGSGSRVRFILNGVFAVFHRPHPSKEADRGAVASVKRFLANAGVKQC